MGCELRGLSRKCRKASWFGVEVLGGGYPVGCTADGCWFEPIAPPPPLAAACIGVLAPPGDGPPIGYPPTLEPGRPGEGPPMPYAPWFEPGPAPGEGPPMA